MWTAPRTATCASSTPDGPRSGTNPNEWARLEPLLPSQQPQRGGRWADPAACAVAAGLGEAGGSTLIALGLGTPATGSVAAGTMIAATSVHSPNGFFATSGGYECPALLGLAAAALSLTGPGDWSLDAALGHARPGLVQTRRVVVAVIERARAAKDNQSLKRMERALTSAEERIKAELDTDHDPALTFERPASTTWSSTRPTATRTSAPCPTSRMSRSTGPTGPRTWR